MKSDNDQLFIFLSNVLREKDLQPIVLKLKSMIFQYNPQIYFIINNNIKRQSFSYFRIHYTTNSSQHFT